MDNSFYKISDKHIVTQNEIQPLQSKTAQYNLS